MGRHAEGDDVVLAVELEVRRVVAAMAVEDEEAINPSCSSFGVLVEVLNPIQTKLIGIPTICGRKKIIRPLGNRLFSYQEERW